MPRVLRDGRPHAITAKGKPSKTPQPPSSSHLWGGAHQTGEGTWRVGASLLKPDLTLARYAECTGPQCKLQGFEHRANCMLERASSCILHTQPWSGGLGASGLARHSSFLARSKVPARCLWTGRLRGFRRRRCGTRFSTSPSRPSLGTPRAKRSSTDSNPDQKKVHVRKNR
jgi:hypothetical protein